MIGRVPRVRLDDWRAWWFGAAVAAAPVLEFITRGRFGNWRAGEAFGSGFLFAGTLLALAATASRTPAAWGRPAGAAGWLAALLAGAAVSGVAGGEPLAGVPGFTAILLGAMSFLAVGAGDARTRGRAAEALAAGLLAGGALAASVALWQKMGGLGSVESLVARVEEIDPRYAGTIRARLEEGRAFSFFLYPNALAGYLLFSLPIALGRFARGPCRAGYGLLALLLGGGVLVSGSMGAAASLAVAAGVAALRGGRKRFRLLLGGAAVLAVIGTFLIRPPRAAGDALSAKFAHWAAAVAAPRSVAGVALGDGPGRYGETVGAKLPDHLKSRYAHNWLVETYRERGLAGLAVLLGFLGWGLRRVLSARRDAASPDDPGFVTGWIAGLAHCLVDFDYALPGVAFAWWSVGGVLLAAGARASPPAESGRFFRKPWRTGWRGAWLWSLAGTIAILPLFAGAAAAVARAAVLGAVAATLGWLALGGAAPPVRARTDWPWLGLVLLGTAWVFVSPAPGPAYAGVLVGAGLLGVVWLTRWGLAAAGGDALERKLRAGVCVVATGYAAWAVGQRLVTGGPAQASFPSPNFLGAFLAFGFGLALVRLARGGERLLPAVTAAATGLGILATGSHGAALAAVAAASLALLLARGKAAGGVPDRRLWLGAAAVAVPLLAVIVAVPRLEAVGTVHRAGIIREALRLAAAEPLGIGPGRFAAGSALVRSPSITSAGIGRYSLGARFAHCDPLQFAVEWGIPGLILMAWGLALAIRQAAVSSRLPWAGAAAGVLVHGCVDFPLHVPVMGVLLAVAVGAMSASGGVRRPGRPGGGAKGWVAAAVALGVLLAFLRPALSRWLVERPPTNLAARLARAGDARGLFPLSADAAAMEGRALWDILWDVLDADPAAAAGWAVARRAEGSLRDAAALSGGEAAARMEVGKLLLERAQVLRGPGRRRGDLARAREEFAAAAAAAPRWYAPPLWLAQGWMEERRWERAREALEEARRLEPLALRAVLLRGEIEARQGNPAAARREYRRALLLRAHLGQRPGINPYEAALIWFDSDEAKGRLVHLDVSR